MDLNSHNLIPLLHPLQRPHSLGHAEFFIPIPSQPLIYSSDKRLHFCALILEHARIYKCSARAPEPAKTAYIDHLSLGVAIRTRLALVALRREELGRRG